MRIVDARALEIVSDAVDEGRFPSGPMTWIVPFNNATISQQN